LRTVSDVMDNKAGIMRSGSRKLSSHALRSTMERKLEM